MAAAASKKESVSLSPFFESDHGHALLGGRRADEHVEEGAAKGMEQTVF